MYYKITNRKSENLTTENANPTMVTGVNLGTSIITYTVTNGQCTANVTKEITVTPTKTPTVRIKLKQ